MSLTDIEMIVGITESVAMVLALIIGGIWTYNRFIKGREPYPRAHIEHRVFIRKINDDKKLIRLTVEIENIGKSLFELGYYDIRLNQVLPLSSEISEKIQKNVNPVDTVREIILWENVSRYVKNETGYKFELEPTEKDEIHFDFIVDNNIEVIEIYSYFKNKMKKDPGIGWGRQTLHDLGIF